MSKLSVDGVSKKNNTHGVSEISKANSVVDIVNEEVTQNLLKGVTEILIDHDAPSEMYDWYNLKLVRPA